MVRGTIKKAAIVCVALFLVTVLAAGLAGSIKTQTASSTSTASAVTVKSTTTLEQKSPTTAAHPIFLSYEQPTILQQQSYAGPFVGSINSNVYHYTWCSEAKKILQKNLVTFATVGDACAAGYRPCEVCNPPACASQTAMITLTRTITPKWASTPTANVAEASAAPTG